MSKVMLAQGIGIAVYTLELALLLWVSQSRYKKKYYVPSKMLCSVTFVVLAIVFALVSHHMEYFFGFFPALCFCLLGDLFMGLYQVGRQKRKSDVGNFGFYDWSFVPAGDVVLSKQKYDMVECFGAGDSCYHAGDYEKSGFYEIWKSLAVGNLLLYYAGIDVVQEHPAYGSKTGDCFRLDWHWRDLVFYL